MLHLRTAKMDMVIMSITGKTDQVKRSIPECLIELSVSCIYKQPA